MAYRFVLLQCLDYRVNWLFLPTEPICQCHGSVGAAPARPAIVGEWQSSRTSIAIFQPNLCSYTKNRGEYHCFIPLLRICWPTMQSLASWSAKLFITWPQWIWWTAAVCSAKSTALCRCHPPPSRVLILVSVTGTSSRFPCQWVVMKQYLLKPWTWNSSECPRTYSLPHSRVERMEQKRANENFFYYFEIIYLLSILLFHRK